MFFAEAQARIKTFLVCFKKKNENKTRTKNINKPFILSSHYLIQDSEDATYKIVLSYNHLYNELTSVKHCMMSSKK